MLSRKRQRIGAARGTGPGFLDNKKDQGTTEEGPEHLPLRPEARYDGRVQDGKGHSGALCHRLPLQS